jgi:hypothetical protein
MFDWLDKLAGWLVFEVFGMQDGKHFTEAVHFFIYDSIKILILLFAVIFLMGIVNSYFPVERVRNFLSRKKLYGLEYLMASLFGVVTPFCSCSSVPLFIGFGVNENNAKQKAIGVDGVIVGSEFIKVLLDNSLNSSQKIKTICQKAKNIKEAINS